MTAKFNYWKITQEELVQKLIDRDIAFDPDNFQRREAIDQLVQWDAENGELEEPVEISDEGEAAPPKIKRKYTDVIFHNQEGFPKYVFLGLNGTFLYLPRECLCRIPSEYMAVVHDAVTHKIVQYKDPKTQGMAHTTVRVPRFSYQVVGQGEI